MAFWGEFSVFRLSESGGEEQESIFFACSRSSPPLSESLKQATLEYPNRRSEKVNCQFLNYRFSFRKLQIFISQTTDSYFANYRFSFRELQILISQTTDSHFANCRFPFRFVPFVPFHFVSQTTVSRRIMLCRSMTVTQWSASLVCVKCHPRRLKRRSNENKRYFSRSGIRPSSLGLRTVDIAQGKLFRQVPVLIFDYSVPSLALSRLHFAPGGDMTITRVLILGYSFIRRLREYIGRNTVLDANLHILEGIELKWHEVGGRKYLKPFNLIFLWLKCSSLT